MFKLMDKKIIAILCSKFLLNWPYAFLLDPIYFLLHLALSCTSTSVNCFLGTFEHQNSMLLFPLKVQSTIVWTLASTELRVLRLHVYAQGCGNNKILYLSKENFTCPKEQISLYLTVLKQY